MASLSHSSFSNEKQTDTSVMLQITLLQRIFADETADYPYCICKLEAFRLEF